MDTFISSAIKEFNYYRSLGEKTIERLNTKKLHFTPDPSSNSIAVIMQHLHGNMMSRWTDFLTSDGEKKWRNRDGEFKNNKASKETLLQLWDEGWETLIQTLKALDQSHLTKKIVIRNMRHSVVEAINRQLTHYAFHVGQIVFLGKMQLGNNWDTLSIPLNQSEAYNKDKFLKSKRDIHYTDDL